MGFTPRGTKTPIDAKSPAPPELLAQLEQLKRLEKSPFRLPLQEFIPAVTKIFKSPGHLKPLTDLFERIRKGEAIRAVVSVPPRFGKTETLLHAIVWLLGNDPAIQVAYVSYSNDFSQDKSRKARNLALLTGMVLDKLAWGKQNWRTGKNDGGVWATSLDGQITGQGFHLILVDDPVKDRATAESSAAREHIYEWFTDTLFTRLEPNASIIIVQTRWHPDDLAGRLIKEGFEKINLPALNEHGESLWPERFASDALRSIHSTIGDYGWYSLYQGEPRGRGNSLFRDVCLYHPDDAPVAGQTTIGVDFAYTAKTKADYSVAVVMRYNLGFYYILDIVRIQAEAPKFRAKLKILQDRFLGARTGGYIGGTEKGVVQMMQEDGLSFFPMPAVNDKFVRAQPLSAAWNAGLVRVPEGAPWLNDFLSEVCGFTGVNDSHDDQVDAAAGAFDMLANSKVNWEMLAAMQEMMPKPLTF